MKLKLYDPHKSVLGIPANWAAALIYIVPGIVGMLIPSISAFTLLLPILLILIDRQSKLVQFHALQYILMSLTLNIALYLLILLCYLGETFISIAFVLSEAATIGMFGALLFSMYKAFLWRSWRVPVLGALASRIVKEEIES